MDHFCAELAAFIPSPFLQKSSILDIRLGYKCVSAEELSPFRSFFVKLFGNEKTQSFLKRRNFLRRNWYRSNKSADKKVFSIRKQLNVVKLWPDIKLGIFETNKYWQGEKKRTIICSTCAGDIKLSQWPCWQQKFGKSKIYAQSPPFSISFKKP